MKQLKKITSLTALLSFIVLISTSVILYIEPHGRIANWADWRLFGLSKEQWGGIHINMGTLFLITIFLHIYFNWNLIVTYLKNRNKEFKFFTMELNVALIVTVVVTLGTYMEIPPFSSFLKLSEDIKTEAIAKYGEPPYGHAELTSLVVFTKKMNIDYELGLEALESKGIEVLDKKQTLRDIAKENNVSPQFIYDLMKPVLKEMAKKGLPETAPEGLGKRTIADLCHEYDLNIKRVIAGLDSADINTEAEKTFKETAKQYSLMPSEVYDKIRETYK